MEAFILDSNFQMVGVVDTFESFIWTDRFCGYGDFEVYLPSEAAVPELLTIGNYLTTKKSDRIMIIEDISIEVDPENGSRTTITGRSLESILERRVIWGQVNLDGSLQSEVENLLDDNVIVPSISARAIDNFEFVPSTDDTIADLDVDTQFFGENLYDAILSLCESQQIGFRILLNNSNKFAFELYVGANRTFSQTKNPWVIFSPDYDNLLSSNYFKSMRKFKNAALIAGEGDGSNRTLIESCSDESEGLQRRELYVDSSTLSRTIDGTDLTATKYKKKLTSKGKEHLLETQTMESFEGEIDATKQFVYGVDFMLGDIVQIVNEYGMRACSRVSEVVQCHDASGETMIPTFTSVTEVQ